MQNEEATIEVTRTYLQMTSPNQLTRTPAPDGDVRIELAQRCPASFFRYLYREVGRL